MEEPMNPDIRVEAREYLGEVERVCEFLQKETGWQECGERCCWLSDNPLLLPFQKRIAAEFS